MIQRPMIWQELALIAQNAEEGAQNTTVKRSGLGDATESNDGEREAR